MPLRSVFEAPPLAMTTHLHSAQVTGVSDPLGLGRVQIRMLNCMGHESQDSLMWARVAVPFAGENYGSFLLPGTGDEVVISFLNGDSRFPVVIGSLWHGGAKPTETLPGDKMDRWTITGKEGSRIAIVEESKSQATVSITVPGGVSGMFHANGSIELITPQASIKLDSEGIEIKSKTKVEVKASSEVSVNSPQVTVNSPMSTFSGKITCASIETASITSAAYSVGAGNVW
jgi:uncharacterized protein involved in type VI secretion and phage assembly